MDVFAFGKGPHGDIVRLTPSLELGQIGSCAASLVSLSFSTPARKEYTKMTILPVHGLNVSVCHYVPFFTILP